MRFRGGLDLRRRDFRPTGRARDPLESGAVSGSVNHLSDARFQTASAINQKKKKQVIEADQPPIKMAGMQLMVHQEAKEHEVDQDRGGNEFVTQSGAGQAFRSAVVFGHGLERDTPPEVSVNLDVPFVPAGIARIAPAFFVEQSKHRPEKVMPVLAFFAPVTSIP